VTPGGAVVRLADRYVLGRVLGRGATGAVYAGHDGHLDRPVAVKVLIQADDTLTTPERFQREARTTARLNHPNIVAVYDVGRVGEYDTVDAAPGTPFLVMELLTGGNWREELARGQPTPQQIARALAGVARALAAAHAVGVTHRDIKPANVLLTANGEAKLADFGIAKSTESTGLTRPGDIVGTLAYTAAECLEGQAATSAADVWSFGVMLYESLAGHRPFEQETIGALITAIQSGRYRSLAYDLPTLTHPLSAAVDRCLDPDPPHRPTAAELADVLAEAGAPSPERPISGIPISGGPPVAGPPNSGRPVSGGAPISGVPASGVPISGAPVSGGAPGWPVGSGGRPNTPPPAPPTSSAFNAPPAWPNPTQRLPPRGGQPGGPPSGPPGARPPGGGPNGGQPGPRPPAGPPSRGGPPSGGGPTPYGMPAKFPPPAASKKRRRWLIPVALFVVFGLLVGGIFGVRGLLGKVSGCKGSLPLVVASSPEKSGIMAALADRYDTKPGNVDGTCIHVTIETVKSGDAVNALVAGWPTADYGTRPDVWSPASSVWVGLVGQRAGAIGTALNLQSLARSPLVIAAPESTAKALGWPAKSPSWKDIAKYAGDEDAWEAVSHSSGAFMFARTNPLVSTSGLHATLAAYLAAPGRTGDVTADLKQPSVKLFLRTLERSTDRYGDTTLTFLDALRQQEESGQSTASTVSALAVEEQTVWAYNQGQPMSAGDSQQPAPKEKLVAMHPSDGTLVSDHPYVEVDKVIDAPWVTAAKRTAAQKFMTFLLADEQQAVFRQHGFRGADDKLDPSVVKSAGGLLNPDSAKTFPAPQPAAVATLLDAWKNLNRPAKVLLVLDTSGSMNKVVPGAHKTRLQLASEGAEDSLNYFGTNDRVGLWEFATHLSGSSDHREIVPIIAKNQAALVHGLKNLKAAGNTGLYDTCRDAVAEVRSQADPDGINAVVLLTDGDNADPGSISVATLLAGLKNQPGKPAIRVYPVAFGGDLTPSGRSVLNQIAKVSGGRFYDSADPRRIDSVLGDVMSNF
jgi:Ca-activated chloride channel family protein